MPKLAINIEANYEDNRRLTIAIKEAGIDIGHRCGGNSACTTCRVEFLEGEPEKITRAEYNKLKEKDMLGKFRLSCQIIHNTEMKIKPIMTLQNVEGWTDTGPELAKEISPEAEWLVKTEIEDFA